MDDDRKFSRRGFLGASAALGAAGMIAQFGCAPAQTGAARRSAAAAYRRAMNLSCAMPTS